MIGEEVHVKVNYGYGKNLSEQVVGFVKLGENIHKILMVELCQGVLSVV